jgi:putative tryptophan/tyrosine transport system substrate-binding protein
MKRRHFITLAVAAAALPRAALAQSGGQVRQIGVLMPTAESDPEMAVLGDSLRRELQGLGWTGGRNLRIAYRWGAGDAARIRAYASELVTMAPDVILAGGVPAVAPLHRLTDHVPIVFVSVSDPVGQGLVKSLAHPGGNITGMFSDFPEFGTKWLELLKEVIPGGCRASRCSGTRPRARPNWRRSRGRGSC